MSKNPLEDFEFLSKLIVAIGEVSEITGVSTRQIRYWEEKGFITSNQNSNSKTRRYDYYQIKKILLIKGFMEQGYTLDAAVAKTTERLTYFNDIFKQLKTKSQD